jgi:hypothetical protein
MMYDYRFGASLRTFKVVTVYPPPAYRPKLHEDWYTLIEGVYSRVHKASFGATRVQLFQHVNATVEEYSSWDHSSGFIRHAEVHLIQYLINHQMTLVLVSTAVHTVSSGSTR